ncbi:MAG: methylamine utilization protein [Pseudomonadota bacterium]
MATSTLIATVMNRILCKAAVALVLAQGACAHATELTVQVNDSAGKPVADAIVYLESEAMAAAPKVIKHTAIEQRGLKFQPMVSVIQTGNTIGFPNNDKVKHHIYSFSPAKKFDQKLYSGDMAATQVFDKAGTVVLGCNIHDKMIAYIKVVDTPLFAKSDAAGAARIEVPAAGKYSVKLWHYNMSGAPSEQALVTKPGEAQAAVAFKIAMKPPVPEAPASEPAY